MSGIKGQKPTSRQYPMRDVLRSTQGPFGRWSLDLSCGHEIWKATRGGKRTRCVRCPADRTHPSE